MTDTQLLERPEAGPEYMALGADRDGGSAAGPSRWRMAREVATLPVATVVGHQLGAVCERVAFGAPSEWTMLAELSALWVLGAFLAGSVAARWVDSYRTVWASATGVILLISATFGYYSNTPNPFPMQTSFWFVASVAAGLVFGACGALVVSDRIAVRLFAALAVSAGVVLDISPLVAFRPPLTEEVQLVLANAVLLPWVFALVGRTDQLAPAHLPSA